MDKKNRIFPLVADDEIIIEAPKLMKLYDNEDLITNINGHYVDKNFDNTASDYPFVAKASNIHKTVPNPAELHNTEKSYASIAREEARQDIKKKRQAYLSKDLAYSPRSIFPKKVLASSPKFTNDLRRIASKLQQEDYILADIATSYPDTQDLAINKHQKNNYDFLKKSQIYNKKEMAQNKEKKIAQELNLTRFQDIN
ncbi:hypothetical protein [Streptococcus marimammalium]|uniref:hypothetical protein n=1 Tax=Streptococcus marimammalium TaxID=269666 RepID=UPI00035EB390|nr:hypothetical protein [Streptococcus marimammalium]